MYIWSLGDNDVVEVYSSTITNVSLVPNVGSGGGCACLWADEIWQIFTLSPQLWCEPNTALKIKLRNRLFLDKSKKIRLYRFILDYKGNKCFLHT